MFLIPEKFGSINADFLKTGFPEVTRWKDGTYIILKESFISRPRVCNFCLQAVHDSRLLFTYLLSAFGGFVHDVTEETPVASPSSSTPPPLPYLHDNCVQ